ncbi:AAA protein [Rhodococcus phage ReqiDocB7]|uniref:ATPase n=1 Tax=Rhodococcus phage ReqiDocB7 TaxID=691966 RepID=UPI0001CDD85E|nr:ATPase [Rhodococcus phage ReqiDocB7]ADD80855.1 AAA protein [Rhodococcus phage ReqiDocB7]
MTEVQEETTAPAKSCATCPSMLAALSFEGQVSAYGTILKADTCPLKGKLLGSPEGDPKVNSKIKEQVARTCDSHGKPRPRSAKDSPSLAVALPMPTMPTPEGQQSSREQWGAPHSCRSCHFHVDSKVVQKEFGMNYGYCAKRGILVSQAKTGKVAEACTEGEMIHAPNIDEHIDNLLGDAILFPELQPAFPKLDKFGANVPQPEAPVQDPQDYSTDKPVTQEDKDCGIKAWREIWNDSHTKSVMLPIFDRDFFINDPDELAKIPQTGDENHPELYKDHDNLLYKISAIWDLGETPALHGVAGTGKTEAFRWLAWLMGLPFERVSITKSTELDDLQGKTHYEEGKGTYFVEGRIPRAWAKPCVQVLDEPNVGGPEVWQFIRPMTDNAKQLVLDANEGQVVDRHKFSYLGMAMNPAWDARNIGAEVISDADGSRLMHIFVDYPTEKLEKEIILKRCKLDGFDLPSSELSTLMKISAELRKLGEDGALPVTWGIRQNIKVARALRLFSMPEAFRLAAADYLEPEAREMILSEVNKSNH